MSGYTPLFSSLTTGTLCGRWPDIGLWPIVLSMADRHGIVDVTPAYISGVTGLPLPEVAACMKRFCEPDPYSRSGVESGARLTLIDEHRDWGWHIVNHSHYREKARKAAFDAARVQDGRNAQRMGTRRDPTAPALTRAHPPSDSDSDSDSDSKSKKQTKSALTRSARCPKDFLPDLDFARAQIADIDAEQEAEKFRDHEFKNPRSDWSACWRTWIRNCRDRGQYAKKATGVQPIWQ